MDKQELIATREIIILIRHFRENLVFSFWLFLTGRVVLFRCLWITSAIIFVAASYQLPHFKTHALLPDFNDLFESVDSQHDFTFIWIIACYGDQPFHLREMVV